MGIPVCPDAALLNQFDQGRFEARQIMLKKKKKLGRCHYYYSCFLAATRLSVQNNRQVVYREYFCTTFL